MNSKIVKYLDSFRKTKTLSDLIVSLLKTNLLFLILLFLLIILESLFYLRTEKRFFIAVYYFLAYSTTHIYIFLRCYLNYKNLFNNSSNESIAQLIGSKFSDINRGITATAPGFYGPQGRKLRLSPSINDLHQKMRDFSFNGNRITNFEMETSALYFLGQSLGHNTLTICAIIGNRFSKKYSKDYKKTIRKMIDLVLKRFC